MKQGDDTRTKAEVAFQTWLDQFRSGNEPDLDASLADQPAGIRRELRKMIEDYQALRKSMGDTAPLLEAGRVLGDFKLVREIGRGGMSVVWEAEQISLNRKVALKLLSPQYALSEKSRQRFEREARAGGRLAHPGIVQTYGVGAADGVHYIAQELVPGSYTLADSLADLREAEKLPDGYYRGVAELFAKIADALRYAHDQGVIHRDIKPGNILLTEQDEPRVADFGLARIQDELGISRTGEIEGTPYYMSPEQAAAKSMGIDHRTDVFSLGSTLYEALTLARPFDGDTSQQVFRKILTVDPPDPGKLKSRVPRDLAVISMKAVEKDPNRRYDTMEALRDDLQRFLAGRPIVAKPAGPIVRAIKWSRRHPAVSTGILVAGVAFAAIAGLLTDNITARKRAEEGEAQAEEARGQALMVAEKLRLAQLDLLASQEDLIRTLQDAGVARKYADTVADRSIDLARAYLAADQEERAVDWLESAPIPADRLEALSEDGGLAPLLNRNPHLLDALMKRSARRYPRPGLDAEDEPLDTEVYSGTEHLRRLWCAPGKYRGVVYDAESSCVLGLRIGGEVDVLDEGGQRDRSFLLHNRTTSLRKARLGKEAGSSVVGFGHHRYVHAANSLIGTLWRYECDASVYDVWPCDLDGDGIDEILVCLNGMAGLRVLNADGTLRLDVRGVTNPSTVTGMDLDQDGHTEILSSNARGVIEVRDDDGQKLDSIEAGMYVNLLRPRSTADGVQLLALGLGRKLALLSGDGDVRVRVELWNEFSNVTSASVTQDGRWLALSSSDYNADRSHVGIVDLEKQRKEMLIEFRQPERAPQQPARDVLAELSARTPEVLKELESSDDAGARQVAWMPGDSTGSPVLLVATLMGLRAYQVER